MPKVSGIHNITNSPKRVLIICGPTATGKTKLAVALAKRFNGELVNADSRQVYQGLSIISGKDIPAGENPVFHERVVIKGDTFSLVTYDLNSIPIWLYDVAPPTKPLSIAYFHAIASFVIEDIVKRKKLPIVVGGTGYYLSSFFHSIDTLDVPNNALLRLSLKDASVDTLQQKLTVADPARWKDMNNSDRNNSRRLIRALEVADWKATHAVKKKEKKSYDIRMIGLRVADERERSRIQERVELRFEQGVLEEAKTLRTISTNLPAASTLGLSTLIRYVNGECSLEEAQKTWVREECQYAKRQMVWFKAQSGIHWIDATDPNLVSRVEALVSSWYT